MMRPNPYFRLLGALDFSLIDLDANRRGHLSPRQRERLEKQRWREVSLAVAGFIVLLVCGIAFELRLMLVGFGAACLTSYVLAVEIRFAEDMTGTVSMVRGRLQFDQPGLFPFLACYNLRVGNEDFVIGRSLQRVLNTEQTYCLYYAPGSRTILAAEVAA
jgi:hypothetical protein